MIGKIPERKISTCANGLAKGFLKWSKAEAKKAKRTKKTKKFVAFFVLFAFFASTFCH